MPRAAPVMAATLPDSFMNRRDALTTVALAGAAIAATGSARADTAPGSTLERIKKSGVLRIAVIAGQDPYFHKDLTTNQWSGACIDMVPNYKNTEDYKKFVVEVTESERKVIDSLGLAKK